MGDLGMIGWKLRYWPKKLTFYQAPELKFEEVIELQRRSFKKSLRFYFQSVLAQETAMAERPENG